MSKRFRFGLSFAAAPTGDFVVETIKKAADSGFSVISTADHISARHATMPFLAFAAAVSTLRVSPMVAANDYRHPVSLAREAATIDILSNGRFELGIGTGWIQRQYDSVGLPYRDAGTRVDRLEEAIDVVLGCWSGEPFSFDGKHYRLDDATCPSPVQTPHPPLMIAGSGRRMLRIAGERADIVGISPLSGGSSSLSDFGSALGSSGRRIASQVRWIRESAGARFDSIELSAFAHHLAVCDDPDRMAQQLADDWGSSAEDVLASPHVLLGSDARIESLLVERRETYGLSYVVFSSLDLDQVAPIVGRLAGT